MSACAAARDEEISAEVEVKLKEFIIVDKETGVNYLYHAAGYSGGLTVLVDRDGKPVISTVSDLD